MRTSVIVICLLAGLVVALACKSKSKPNLRQLFAAEIGQLDAAIRSTVADEERAEGAVAILVAIRAEEDTMIAELTAFRAEFERLNRDYDAPRESFVAVFAEMRQHRDEARTRVIPRIVELQELLTAEEWSALYREMGELDSRWETLVLQ